jgi:protease PrsW
MRSGALPPPVPPPTPPGWYPDPWQVAQFRWWDGRAWSANIAYRHGFDPQAVQAPSPAVGGATSPRLPAWLSRPVLIAAFLVAPLFVVAAFQDPVVLVLALVPLLFIVPVLLWLDRLEPEPWTSRVHAFLWGATISVLVAGFVNSVVMLAVSERAAAVVSAPLIEETMKGLGILWAVRRRELDGAVDGLVYAGWIAAGFAMVENIEYFLVASADGVLADTFVARALIVPFAHPLFTAWTGLAIGVAVARRQRLPWAAWWGWLIAVALHAAWNGSIVAAVEADDERIILVAALGFVVVFVITALMVVLVRRAERRAYIASMPYLAQRYEIPPHEVGQFSTWPEMLAARRSLQRDRRRQFDDTHAALARLAALHARPGPTDPVDEERLAGQLEEARAGMMAPSD